MGGSRHSSASCTVQLTQSWPSTRPPTDKELASFLRIRALVDDWIENGCYVDPPPPAEPPPAPKPPIDYDDPRIIALRRECERLAAMYRAPLPEGDAGLVAAVQRWREMRDRFRLMRNMKILEYGRDEEEEIVEPILYAAEHELDDMIEAWPAQGLIGVAVKLRYALAQQELGMTDMLDLIEGEQLVEIIERLAHEAQP
jgi:hypothetical protein